MTRSRIELWAGLSTAPLAVGAAVSAATWAGLNAPTAGFLLLLVVLLHTLRFGFAAGAVGSIAATLAFNFFFLPPFYTLTIDDPANWAALAAFGLTAWVTGRLVATERLRAIEAESKRRETEALYDLCFSLFTATNRPGGIEAAAAKTVSAIGAARGALFLQREGQLRQVWPVDDPLADAALHERIERAAAERDVVVLAGSPTPLRLAPLEAGGSVAGALLLVGGQEGTAFLASAARLLALAIERDRLLEEAAHGAAMAESDRLKSALLRAVSHDLRSPLTAMALGLESLVRDAPAGPERERLLAVARERERLGRRIDQLLAAARLEAGLLKPHAEPIPAAELFRAAREHLELVLAGREVRVVVDPETPEPSVDAALVIEALVNLLENASRMAPAERPLELAARSLAPDRVALEVRDRGPGFADPSSNEGGRGGLGLTITRQLAAANGGALELENRPDGGAIARLVLPAGPAIDEPRRAVS